MHNIWSFFKSIKFKRSLETNIQIIVLIILMLLNYFVLSTKDSTTIIIGVLIILLKSNNSLIRRYEDMNQQSVNLFQSNLLLPKSGLLSLHSELPEKSFFSKLKKSKEQIKIFQTWIPGMKPLPSALIEAAKRGVDVQILLIQPQSEFAKQRTIDMRWSPTKPFEAFDNLLWIIQKHNLQDVENFQVKFYNCLPPFLLYSIDDWMLLGIYWHPNGATTGLTLELGKTPESNDILVHKTFNAIWDSNTTITIDEMSNKLQTRGPGSKVPNYMSYHTQR